MAKTDHRQGARTAPAFHLLRQFIVRAMAGQKTPTVDIAKKLDISRSFAIKQAVITLKPRTAAERRILKVATEMEATLKRQGIGGLLGGVDITTELAGGERPKLGPLKDRIAKRKAGETKAKTKAPAKTKAAKPAAKKPESSKVVKALAAGAAKATAKKLVKSVTKPNALAEAAKPAHKTRKPKPSAKTLKAPLPAEKLTENPTPQPPAAEGEDLLSALGVGTAPPDMPI